MILVGMLIEGTFHYHPLPKLRSGLTVFYGILGSYTAWMVYLGVNYNIWVYPFINLMPNIVKPFFFAGMAIAGFGLYKIGVKYHQILWTKRTGKAKVALP